MDDLTADELIANFSWGREEIQPSDNGRAPDGPTVWVGVERPAPVVGLQVGDYSVRVTLGEDGGEGRCGYATTLPPRVHTNERQVATTNAGANVATRSAGRSGPIPHSPPGRTHVE